MDLEKSDKLEDINTILKEDYSRYYDNAYYPWEIKQQIWTVWVFWLSGFINDVNAGIAWGLRWWSTTTVFSSSAYNAIAWTSGTIQLSNWLSYSINSWSLTLTSTHYIFLDTQISTTDLQNTTIQEDALWWYRLLVAVAFINADTSLKAIVKTFWWQGDTFTISTLNIAASAVTSAKTSIAAINPVDWEINANKVGTTQIVTWAVTSAKSNIAMRWWSQTCTFSVTDSDTVAWWSGTFTTSDGTSYSIWASNTGNMVAKTYIYLDTAVSTTAYQTTTTASTAVWDWKVMVAIAQNNTTEATYQVLNNNSYNIDASNIVTWSITANEIATSAITTDKIYAWAVTAVKITSYNFQLSAWSFTNNSPSAWKVAWTWVKVVYNGTEYTITNSSCLTTDKHIYWQLASPTVFSASATLPALWNDDFLVVFNNSGTAVYVWNSTVINGNRITTGSIVASNIAAWTITANEIASATITGTNIAATTITASNIAAWTITATQIAAWTITANEIASNTITANKLSTTLLYAWAITLDTNWYIKWWQTAYDSGTGFFLGYSTSTYKFSIGNSAWNKLTWDGSALSVNGAITAWSWSSIGTTYLSGTVWQTNLDVVNNWWTQTCAFSVTDADTIAWWSGSLIASNGTTYSITGGNTGNMVAKTYIYLDTAVSTTAYQTTTTASTAVGAGKVLVAVAQNWSVEATYQIMGTWWGGMNIDAANIVASSITANEIAASTITTGKIASNTIVAWNIASLAMTGKSCTFDTGTIWGWTMSSSDLSATSGWNKTILSSGSTAFSAWPTGSPTVTITQAGALTCTSWTIGGATIWVSTFTWWTFQTASSWNRVILDSSWVSCKDSWWVTRVQLANGTTPSLAFFNWSWTSVWALWSNTYTPTYWWWAINVLYTNNNFVAWWVFACTSHLEVWWVWTAYFQWKMKIPVGSNLY